MVEVNTEAQANNRTVSLSFDTTTNSVVPTCYCIYLSNMVVLLDEERVRADIWVKSSSTSQIWKSYINLRRRKYTKN